MSSITNFEQQQTMSSLEISEITGKEHKNVLADIRNMLIDLGIQSAEFSADYTDAKGRTYPCFNLPKRETLILTSGYSVQQRAAIIDRWMELESGNALPAINDPQINALVQGLIKVDQLETRVAQNEQYLTEVKTELEEKIDQVDIKSRNGVPLGYIGRKESWRKFGGGLSEDVFRMALDIQNVPKERYVHTTDDGYEAVSWAYKLSEIETAIDIFIDDAIQDTPKYCKSPMLRDKRFRFVKQEAA